MLHARRANELGEDELTASLLKLEGIGQPEGYVEGAGEEVSQGKIFGPLPGKRRGKLFSLPNAKILGILLSASLVFIVITTHKLYSLDGIHSTWSSLARTQASQLTTFSGAFARVPTVSSLSQRQRRMTLIGVWNKRSCPKYLRHLMYSAQANADSIDFLLINREMNDACIDWQKEGIDTTWGKNVKIVCMDEKEWQSRHAKFLCSKEYGWDCSSSQYQEVLNEVSSKDRPDPISCVWKVFRGYVFRDLFSNPSSPFWAWIDMDTHLGDFRRYPFNILSQVSLLTTHYFTPELVYMAGQMTAFNMDDPHTGQAWKRIPTLKSPDHFTKALEGRHPSLPREEGYWSAQYMRSDEGSAGNDLSWAIVPDIQGADIFESSHSAYVMSGRDMLELDTSLSRQALEALILKARQEPIDERGSVGWTTQARIRDHRDEQQHEIGIVEQVNLTKGETCRTHWIFPEERQCVPHHWSSTTTPSLTRASLVRFPDSPPGRVHRRLELDQRPRGYQRKLYMHYQYLKKKEWNPWFDFPDKEIDEDHIMIVTNNNITVFRIGEAEREKNIFHRERS